MQNPDGKNPQEEKAKRRSLRPLAAIWPYVARYKGMMFAAFLALMVSALATLAIPLGVRRMIDLGFSGDNADLIDQYFLVMGGIGLVLAAGSAARFFCVNWLGERVVADMREDVFTHLMRLSPGFFDRSQSGEVLSRLTADTTQIKAAAGTAASQALRNLVVLVGSVTMMVVTSPKLSALVLGVIPLIMLPLIAYGRAVRQRSRAAQDTLAEASAFAGEAITGIRSVQAFTSEAQAASRFALSVENAFAAARSRLVARAGLTWIAISLTFVSVVAVLWYGAQDVLAGEMTGGLLSQFVIYALLAAGAVGELAEVWGEVQQAAGSAERLRELLDETPAIKAPRRPQAFPSRRGGRVKFTGVSFAYPTRAGVSALNKISFEVKPGETVAIVGPSGSGKTTVFNLLLRFYDPKSGKIAVDGVDVSKADPRELRRGMALVPQDTAIFDDTAAENIRFGAPEASDEQVRAAAEAALAHDFIMAMPKGYGTMLGERGVTLSGGQRQRIAIARAILRDAPVLLLDEATSALDSESESLVRRALDKVMAGRTTLVIAHRLSTVKKADRILVLDRGRIVEQGTHASLLKKKRGVYARLAALQFSNGAET
ncbi:MAG: ABC transporter transmembrane domain-containing protein [Hyphomicrobiales bacterium]